MNEQPRILIFTGDGKGKTTAALGMAFRASGHGLRSCIIQFIKSDVSVGEIAAAHASMLVEIHSTGLGFVPGGESPRFAEHRAAAQAGLQKAAEIIAGGQFALVILDEICIAVARGLIEERQVVELVSRCAAGSMPGADRPRRQPGLDRPGRHGDRNAMRQARFSNRAPRRRGNRAMSGGCARLVIAGATAASARRRWPSGWRDVLRGKDCGRKHSRSGPISSTRPI